MKRIATLLIAIGVLAGCGSAPKPAPVHTESPAQLAAQQCEVALQAQYSQLGNMSVGQYQAAVNAEAFAGSLPAACETTLLTHADLMNLAATAAS
jgi:hypothetical protein